MRDGYVVSWESIKGNKGVLYSVFDPVEEKIRYARKEDILKQGIENNFGIDVELNKSIGSLIAIPHTKDCSKGAADCKILTVVYKTGNILGLIDIAGQVYLCRYDEIDLKFAASRLNGFNSHLKDEDFQPISSITKKIKYLDVNSRTETTMEYVYGKNKVEASEENGSSNKEVSEVKEIKKSKKEDKEKSEVRIEQTIKVEEKVKKEISETYEWYDAALMKKWVEHSDILDSITMSRKVLKDLKVKLIKIVASNTEMSKVVDVSMIGIGEEKSILAAIKQDIENDKVKIVKLSKYRMGDASGRELVAATEVCKRIWQQ